jgi:hypothetical protein
LPSAGKTEDGICVDESRRNAFIGAAVGTTEQFNLAAPGFLPYFQHHEHNVVRSDTN